MTKKTAHPVSAAAFISQAFHQPSQPTGPQTLPNPHSGMKPQGAFRVFIVALMLFGPYLSSLFAFTAIAAPAVKAAETTSTPAPVSALQAPPTSTTSPAPTNTVIHTTDPWRYAPSISPRTSSCNYVPSGGAPGASLQGIGGSVKSAVSNFNFSGAYTVTLFSVGADNKSYTQAAQYVGGTNFNPGADYAFQGTSLNTNQMYILQFEGRNAPTPGPNDYTSTFFDYFKGVNSAREMGRFSKDTATRIFLGSGPSNTCVAYSLIAPQSLDPAVPPAPYSVTNQPANTVAITMTRNGSDRSFDGAILTGRGVGGRVFLDNGSGMDDQPPLFLNDNGSVFTAAVTAKLYVFNNGQVITPEVAVTNVDNEGYYTLASTNQVPGGVKPITANADGDYLLRFEGFSTNLATSYYCNYIYPGSKFTPSDGFNASLVVPVRFRASQNQSMVLSTTPTDTIISNPTNFGIEAGTPPCTSSDPNKPLSSPGYNEVMHYNNQITGTISLADNPTNPDLTGAYAVAINSSGEIVQRANADPKTGAYTLDGLRPNTSYTIRFYPPNGNLYLGQYYNNKQLDTTGFQTVTTSNYGVNPITPNINASLVRGWSFTGNVSLFPADSTKNDKIQVLVFKTADLLNSTTQPTPVDSVSTDTSGNYSTNTVLVPGITYTLAFVPFGTANIYQSAWCILNTTTNTCTNGGNYNQATPVLISSANTPKPIRADITLTRGVVLQGLISGTGGSTDLTNIGVNVYVYQVSSGGTPISPTLAQFFGVPGTGSTHTYSTAALMTNTDYILKFVPTPSTAANDPGFREGYYCTGSTSPCNNGGSVGSVFDQSQAAKINQSAANVYPNYNVGLYRAAAVSVTLYTYLYDANTNPTAYYNGVRVEVLNQGKPVASALTNNNGQVFIGGLGVQNPNGEPYTLRFTALATGGVSFYDGTFQCAGTGAVAISPPAGVISNVSCVMPKVAGASGIITYSPSSPAIDWSTASLNVFDANYNLLYNLPNDPNNPSFNIFLENNVWKWKLFTSPGDYRFQMVPGPDQRPNYLPSWNVGVSASGSDASAAILRHLTPEFLVNGLVIKFDPGGILVVDVRDSQTGNKIAGANVAFYSGNANNCGASPLTPVSSGQTGDGISSGALGIASSRPYTASLCAVVTPPTGAEFLTGKTALFNLTNGSNVTIITTIVNLLPTPYITGFVRVRSASGVETNISGTNVVAVDPSIQPDQVLTTITATTDITGFYRLRMPNGVPFKLRFSPPAAAGLDVRYWNNTPRQNGSSAFALGTSILQVAGQNFGDFNQIYDLAQGVNQCVITDQLLQSMQYTGSSYNAVISFNSNCQGDTQAVYGTYAGSTTDSQATLVTVTNSSQSSNYSHVVTLTNLTAGSTFYVRGLSHISSPSSTVSATSELQVTTPLNSPVVPSSDDGKNWFFAQGETSQTVPGINETLYLLNNSNNSVNATIQYYAMTGTVGSRSVAVPANSRVEVPVGDPSNQLSMASLGYYGQHSTWVSASASLVVEREQNQSGQVAGYNYGGGYTVAGITAPGRNAWFPDINTATPYDQYISIFNPNSGPACATLYYYHNSGAISDPIVITPQNTVIPALSRRDVRVTSSIHQTGSGDLAPNVNSFSLNVKSAIVSSLCNASPVDGKPQPLVVEEQTRYADPNGTGNLYYKGVTGMAGAAAPTQHWYFLDGQNDKNIDVDYVVVNPNGNTASIVLTYLVENPISPTLSHITRTVTLSVPANQRLDITVPLNQLNQGVPGRRFSFTVQADSDTPVVMQRTVKYSYNTSGSQNSLYHEMGVTKASTQWLFAAGDTTANYTTQAFTDEALNLYNPTGSPLVVNVTYYYSTTNGVAGPPSTSFQNYLIPAYSWSRINPSANPVDPTFQNLQVYPSIGQNKPIAVKILSSQPIFAERLIYKRLANLISGNATYGWNPPGY